MAYRCYTEASLLIAGDSVEMEVVLLTTLVVIAIGFRPCGWIEDSNCGTLNPADTMGLYLTLPMF